ncbi:3-dehydroquinate synthase [Deinococcus peraridilitoris]|uniref:3-dehydroquinate synthetase n=1 Tax=Deinococcus peraridilitoris (strain DSM 19664 / LMG 22246 / CIP 109416 / KR-200) TaxID=937777 RepID=L0A031_DEIPD|nr:3-dehydroquinate synthase [Deinococcus peraridilitoris]AFZ66809.1 3-dehydroquinate synthetase [Deinococcus peraridilitoris DSM 19664]
MMARTIQQVVEVTFRYPVEFTEHLFQLDNPVFRHAVAPGSSAKKVLVVVDDGVTKAHPSLVSDVQHYCATHQLNLVAPPLVLPGGERAKQDSAHVVTVQDAINTHGIDRHSYVVVVGGGAIIDLVGYAAATAHRGVRLVRVPTTVLSQNDSAVGVKNSVNAYGKKNWLGTFAPPAAVLNDRHFLTTLDDRDWLGGLSEAVKVALLKDAAFFAFLEEHATALRARDLAAMDHAVYRCAELHLQHIATSGDPFEQGSSRPLDFGHWAAHKLEALTRYELRHGEAVAIGIALDSTYAHLEGRLREEAWQRIVQLFLNLGLSVWHPLLSEKLDNPQDPGSLIAGLNEFREHLGGQLTITLLDDIGRGQEVHEMDHAVLKRAVSLLERIQKQGEVCPTPTPAR